MSIRDEYAAINPSLLLDFANEKQLDQLVSFSRASTATYYDGKTFAKAEENLLLYSQDFDNAAWTKEAARVTVTANSVAGPDLSTTAETLTIAGGTASSYYYIWQQRNAIVATPYTYSVHVKAGTSNYARIDLQNRSSGTFVSTLAMVAINLTTGAVVSSSGTTSVTNAGNGWWRISVSGTSAASGMNQVEAEIAHCNSAGANLFAPIGTETIYIWGAQLEQRNSISSYTPTTTQIVTNYIPALQTAAAGVPRFDHNPVTGASKGLLFEAPVTNRATYSSDLTNAVWTKAAVTITSNIIVAPDGTLTGDKIVENNLSGVQHLVFNTSTTTAATVYTYSAYFKAAEWTTVRLQLGGGGPEGLFDLVAITATPRIGAIAATITPVGNGWYRCAVVGTSSGSSSQYIYETSANYTGDGYSGIYVWGAQVELGRVASSYIPTAGAMGTKVVDLATVGGGNFSSWYSKDEGTMYAEVEYVNGLIGTAGEASSIRLRESADTGGSRNNISMRVVTNPTAPQADVVVRTLAVLTADTGGLAAGTIVANTVYKRAVGYTSGSIGIYINGIIDTGLPATFEPSLLIDELVFNMTQNGAFYVKKYAHYNERLTNVQLQALTL